MTDNSGSAFPVLDEGKQGVGNLALIGSGLTKREYYAAHAHPDLLSRNRAVDELLAEHGININNDLQYPPDWCDLVTARALKNYADALIAALKEGE